MIKVNKRLAKVILSIGLILMSPTLVKKSSLALHKTEEKIYAKDKEKAVEKHKKQEKIQKEETENKKMAEVNTIESRMLKNVYAAETYIQNKGKSLEKIGNSLGMDMYTIPNKTALTYYNYEEVEDYKGDRFDQEDEIKWLSLVERYYTEEKPYDYENIKELENKKYGLVKEVMEVRTTLPKASLDTGEKHSSIRYIYEYLKLTNDKLTYETFIDKINNLIKELEGAYVNDSSKQEGEIEDLGIKVGYWDSGIEISFYKSDQRFIKEVDSVSGYELVFNSEIEKERYFKSLKNTFNEWRDEKEERGHLYHDNMNGWGEESLFFMAAGVDSSETDISKKERQQIAIESYEKSLSLMYDFVSENVYNGKFPVSKEEFCDKLINSALKAYENKYYSEEVFPGIRAVGTLEEYFSSSIGDLRVYFDFPTEIK